VEAWCRALLVLGFLNTEIAVPNPPWWLDVSPRLSMSVEVLTNPSPVSTPSQSKEAHQKSNFESGQVRGSDS
jgi:hypothetical protein